MKKFQVGEMPLGTWRIIFFFPWRTSPQITKHIVVAEVGAGIADVVMTSDAKELSRYSVNGQRLTAPTKGLNIVKYSDGSVRKEMVK